ncbi:MAG: hypothetical protein Q9170_003855 [Blastenia crenularia]
MVSVGGVGHHLEAVLKHHPDQIVVWAKCVYALELIYLPAVALPKLSILSLYFRIFVNKAFRNTALVIAVNIPNIVTDVAMLILPMPMVWKLHTTKGRKVGLTLHLVFASPSSQTVMPSKTALVRLSNLPPSPDPMLTIMRSGRSVELVTWSIVEPSMYLIAACLPGLRPLFSQIMPKRLVSKLTGASDPSSRNNVGLVDVDKPRGGFQRLDVPFDGSYHREEDMPGQSTQHYSPTSGKSYYERDGFGEV